MNNKSKTVLWTFLSLDYKAMEIYLEEMANKGWMLEKVRRGFAKFRSIEPKNIKFYVDVFKGGGPLMSENTREAKVYRRKCEELGWSFITSQDYLQFFYAEEGKDPDPIQSDEADELQIIKKTLLKNELLSISILLIVSYRIINSSYPIKHTNLLTYISVFGTFIYPVLGISILLMTIYSLTWLFKNNRNVKRGLSIEKPTLRSAKIRGKVMYGLTFIFVFIFIIAIIIDSFLNPNITILILLGPTMGMGIGFTIRYFIKNKAKEKGDGILYAIVGIISAVVIVNIVASVFIRSTFNNTNYNDPIPVGYPIVTMNNINKEVNEGSLVSREFDPGRSPIIPKHYNYWETWDINGKSESLRIHYYEVINPYFVEIVFNSKSEEIKRVLSWRNKSLIQDEKMKDLYNADNLLISEDRDIILIQKGNKVVDLSGKIDFNEGNIREIIIERLFK